VKSKLIPPESHYRTNRQDNGFRQKGAFLAILAMIFFSSNACFQNGNNFIILGQKNQNQTHIIFLPSTELPFRQKKRILPE